MAEQQVVWKGEKGDISMWVWRLQVLNERFIWGGGADGGGIMGCQLQQGCPCWHLSSTGQMTAHPPVRDHDTHWLLLGSGGCSRSWGYLGGSICRNEGTEGQPTRGSRKNRHYLSASVQIGEHLGRIHSPLAPCRLQETRSPFIFSGPT